MKKSSVLSFKIIIYIIIFAAIDIVLTRPFRAMGLPFNFGFISIAVCGAVIGPLFAMFTAFISDLIGVFIFHQGAYFPGYGATAMLRALMYGLLFYKSKDIFAKNYNFRAFIKIFTGCLLAKLFSTLTIPLWETVQSTKSADYSIFLSNYMNSLIKSIPNSAIFLVIQIVVLNIFFKLFKKPIIKMWQKL